MCTGATDIESQGTMHTENLVAKDEASSEETMRAEGDAPLLEPLLSRSSFTGDIGRPTLKEVAEELVALGKIACPVILTSLLIYARSVISVIFLSRMGKKDLAGGSLALGLANITGNSVLKGLAMGMDPICGQAYGARRWSVISQTCLKTLCLLLLVALPISLMWLNVEPILLRLGQDPDITDVAKDYMAFYIPELLAQAVLHPMRSFLRTQGLTAPLTICASIAVVLHIPITYFLAIYLELGVKGVALAIAFNTINMNIGLLIYVAVSESPLKPWHGITVSSIFRSWRPLLSLALPSVFSVCLEWWWYEIMLFLCGLLTNPKVEVAAAGIIIQTAGLIYSFPFSISCSLSTRVGHALGAGEPSRAQWTAIIGIVLAFTFGVLATVFIFTFGSVWGKLYTHEPQVLDLISIGLPLLGLCEICNSPQTAACGVLTGTARSKEGAHINFYSFYVVGLPLAVHLTFNLKMGFRGLWFGLLAAQITCACMMMYALYRTDWKHQALRAEELTSAAAENGNRENGLPATDQ